MYWLALINFRVTGVTGVIAGGVDGLVRAVKLLSCRLPVLVEPILPTQGLATARARGVENSALMLLAEVLKGFSKKRSPALGALVATEPSDKPSIAGRSFSPVAASWNANVPLVPAVPGVKVNAVDTPSDRRVIEPAVVDEKVTS